MNRINTAVAVLSGVVLFGPMVPSAPATAGQKTAQASQVPIAFIMKLPPEVDPGSIGVSVSPDPQAEDALQDGDSVYLLPVSDGISVGSDRTLVVRVDPADLPDSYVDPQGVSTYEVVALGTDGSSWTSTVSPRAVSTPDGIAWASPEEVQPESDPSGARRHADGRALITTDRRVDPVKGGLLVKLSGTGNGTASRSHSARARTARQSSGNCMGPQPRKTQVASKLVWSTLGTTYPTKGSAATMEVSSSRGATYGIGISWSGAYGSWSASGSRTITGGWGFSWEGSSSSRSYRKQVRYRKYKFEYLDSRCNSYKWEPQRETGGTDDVTGITRPDFWRCSHESVGDWFRDRADGYSYELSSSVKFAGDLGIDLSISRQYSKSQSLKYHIVGARHYLCGNGNHDPSIAGKLMERVID